MNRPTFQVLATGISPNHHRVVALKLGTAPEDMAYAVAILAPDGTVIKESTLLNEDQATAIFEDHVISANYSNGLNAVLARCRGIREEPEGPSLSAEAVRVITAHCIVGTWEWIEAIRHARKAGPRN